MKMRFPSRRQLLLAMVAVCAGALLLAAGCRDREHAMTRTPTRQFAADYTAAWNSGEPARVAAFFSPEGTLFVNGTANRGREAIAALARDFMTAFPDLQLSMDELEITPTGATYHWTFVGSNTGPGGTGNAVDFSGYEEWTLGDDGLIAQSLGHFDSEEYQRQLEHGAGRETD